MKTVFRNFHILANRLELRRLCCTLRTPRQLHVMDETYVINQVKEDVCYVSTDFKNDMELSNKKSSENTIVRDYVLPDFTTIRRGYPLLLNQSTQNDNVGNNLSIRRKFRISRISFQFKIFFPAKTKIE